MFALAWLLALWRAGLQMVINNAPSLAPALLQGKLESWCWLCRLLWEAVVEILLCDYNPVSSCSLILVMCFRLPFQDSCQVSVMSMWYVPSPL